MALGSVLDLVKEKLPYLNDGSQDALIESEKTQVMYYLQPYLKKPDVDVENEATYKPLEIVLISLITCKNLLTIKSIELTGGNSSESVEVENTILKKAKADVVEAEFEQFDKNKNLTLAQDVDTMYKNICSQACSTAKTLKLNLSFCEQYKYDMIKPFTIIPSC